MAASDRYAGVRLLGCEGFTAHGKVLMMRIAALYGREGRE